MAEAAGEPFIDYPEGWGNRAVIDEHFAAAGLQRTIGTEVDSFGMALEMVRQDLGVAFLPEPALAGASDISFSPVADADLQWRIQLARSSSRPTTAAGQVLQRACRGGRHAPVLTGPACRQWSIRDRTGFDLVRDRLHPAM